MTTKHTIPTLFAACAILCFAVLPLSADTFGNFTYIDEGTTITISSYNIFDTAPVNIPASIVGKPVTKIANSAFAAGNHLPSVTIPSSVTSIGDLAFVFCSSLTSMTIPSSVTSIGSSAFSHCSGLTSVTIPSSVTSMGYYVFSDCTSLKSVTIPSKITSIGVSTFYNCSSLTSVKIPSSVMMIDNDAFNGCSSLPSVTIPSSVTSILDHAFTACNSLTSVKIPASVTFMGEFAFDSCSSLTAITVAPANPQYFSVSGILFNKAKTVLLQYPEGVEGSYRIPSGVTSIREFAFSNCLGLTSVTIPPGFTSVGYGAFYGCSNLTTAQFLGNAPSVDTDAFSVAAPGFTIHYITGKTGFTSPTWYGYPCVGAAAAPEIDVQQPLGSSLVDGTAKKSFGTVVVGQSGTAKTFTITNTGTSNLNGLALSADGMSAGDFILTPPAKTSLSPGGSTTFNVTFKPTASGTRTGAIHIQSNDANENPFDIKLAGTGAL